MVLMAVIVIFWVEEGVITDIAFLTLYLLWLTRCAFHEVPTPNASTALDAFIDQRTTFAWLQQWLPTTVNTKEVNVSMLFNLESLAVALLTLGSLALPFRLSSEV